MLADLILHNFTLLHRAARRSGQRDCSQRRIPPSRLRDLAVPAALMSSRVVLSLLTRACVNSRRLAQSCLKIIRSSKKNVHNPMLERVKGMAMDLRRGVFTVIAIGFLLQFGSIGAVLAAPEPLVLFKTKCSACHTFGKGVLVGPDLKAVTERHPREWLIAWIRSSETLIRRGDPVAAALFHKFGQQRMPDHDLTDAQIAALLDYLAVGGPAADEGQHLRLAVNATPQDVQLGRKLFFGETRLAGGAVACIYCHSLSAQTVFGGSLAPDLSDAYTRYFDSALDQRLRRTCVAGATGTGADRVAVAESLALRAFLRSVHVDDEPTRINDRRSIGTATHPGR